MSRIEFKADLLATLKDRVVVLTGGATGIGQSAVEMFSKNGAHVIFGDVNDDIGNELASQSPSLTYQHCDVSSYSQQLALFALAEKMHGKIDIVVGNAGVINYDDIFKADKDWTQEPKMREIDINLKGALFTTRIGMAYLRKAGGGDILLTSSTAGFKCTNGLAPYTASKHGLVGLMRGLQSDAKAENIHINVILPYFTSTRLSAAFEKEWIAAGKPRNDPEDVAKAIIIGATANRGKGSRTHGNAKLPFAGKMLWVSGHESYEIEDGIWETEPLWLGKENSRLLSEENFEADKWTAKANL